MLYQKVINDLNICSPDLAVFSKTSHFYNPFIVYYKSYSYSDEWLRERRMSDILLFSNLHESANMLHCSSDFQSTEYLDSYFHSILILVYFLFQEIHSFRNI